MTLHLKQSWFLADGSDVSTEEEKTWVIPLFTACSGGEDTGKGATGLTPVDIMTAARHEVKVKGDGVWVKLNAEQYVPMRVKYPDNMFSGLAAAVRSKAISAADRIGLLSDQFALCKAGKLDPTRLLELLAAYDTEDEPTVLCELLLRLSGLHSLFAATDELQKPFDEFARGLVSPLVATLGWDPRDEDGHLTRKLRGEVIIATVPSCLIRNPALASPHRSPQSPITVMRPTVLHRSFPHYRPSAGPTPLYLRRHDVALMHSWPTQRPKRRLGR